MEIDLAHAGVDFAALAAKLRSEVCIVGGGIAGLTLADHLLRSGHRVTLLEAGGRSRRASQADSPFDAELAGETHVGTRVGRVSALGGCSLTWGGQLLPLPADAVWPILCSELSGSSAEWDASHEAAKVFAAHRRTAPALLQMFPELTPRLSHFLPFSRRNLARTLGRSLRRHPKAQVVLHATVTEINLAPSGDRVVGLTLRTPAGAPLRVEAAHYVLAAGTVETCRLLLASRSVATEGVGNGFGQVGLHFHDHLTLSGAEFTGSARERMVAELRPWIWSGPRRRQTLHSLKLEPGATLRQRLGLLPAMAHVSFEEPEGSGVGALRAFLRARQEGARRAWSDLRRDLPHIFMQTWRLAWEARVRHRRYVSPAARVRLQLNVTQEPETGSHIRLSAETDRWGAPRAVVDWRVAATELATFRRYAAFLRDRLADAGIGEGVHWLPSLFSEDDAALLAAVDDARHAMGGARMGTDPRRSVVDPELRVHGIANLSLASAAVFPDGCAQLPTLTLMALCQRLAERLDRELR